MAKPAGSPKKPLNRAKRMAAAPKRTAPVAKPAPRKPAAVKRAGSRKIKTVAVSEKDLATSAKPSFFRMRTQLLDAGNTELPLAVGDNLWIKIKVYAEGGENHLHAHPYQDHSFIVLDGKACFHGPRGERRTLKRNEGVFLPAGSYYWFEQVGERAARRAAARRHQAGRPSRHPRHARRQLASPPRPRRSFQEQGRGLSQGRVLRVARERPLPRFVMARLDRPSHASADASPKSSWPDLVGPSTFFCDDSERKVVDAPDKHVLGPRKARTRGPGHDGYLLLHEMARSSRAMTRKEKECELGCVLTARSARSCVPARSAG